METIGFKPLDSEHSPNQVSFNIPEWAGTGGFVAESFPSGLKLFLMDLQINQPVIAMSDSSGNDVGIAFYLSGRSENHMEGLGRTVAASPGADAYFTFPDTVHLSGKFSAGRHLRIGIFMESGTLFDLARDDKESFSPFLEGLNETTPKFEEGKMAQDFMPILQQVLTCPYKGKTRSLFLEGKVLELLARKLALIQQEKRGDFQPRPLKPADKQRVHQAAVLLVKDLENPPDLSTLSHAVDLSRAKFHRCFCQVYGLSPLEYLQIHRLELARQLLEQGDHNVSQAAYAVGYNSLSYFSKIFRARYNKPPHEFL